MGTAHRFISIPLQLKTHDTWIFSPTLFNESIQAILDTNKAVVGSNRATSDLLHGGYENFLKIRFIQALDGFLQELQSLLIGRFFLGPTFDFFGGILEGEIRGRSNCRHFCQHNRNVRWRRWETSIPFLNVLVGLICLCDKVITQKWGLVFGSKRRHCKEQSVESEV